MCLAGHDKGKVGESPNSLDLGEFHEGVQREVPSASDPRETGRRVYKVETRNS